MTKELLQIIEYNRKQSRKFWSRYTAAMIFGSAMMYLLMKSL